MRISLKTISAIITLALVGTQGFAQPIENTYVWTNASHSAWKVEPAPYSGYVIAGSKFFTSPNTDIFMTGFDEFGSAQWTRTHASGFTSLQTFWKSFTTSSNNDGYFLVCSGNQGGHKSYAITVNGYGMKFWDRASSLPFGINFGGVCQANNGGYLATGGTNTGNFAAVNFDIYGDIQWTTQVPVSGFGWSVKPAVGGGYILAGGLRVAKIDNMGNLEWSANINLPPSPSGPYTYAEFEEITPLPDGSGFIVTGSCFSNSHSGIYTARLSYSGGVAWAKVNDVVNTSAAGTPVCWVNNAIIDGYGTQIMTSWRRGPVSAGGTMYYQRMDFGGNNIGGITSMANTITVREAFMTKAHQKYVVGGTRGNTLAAYSYVNASLSAGGNSDDRTEPFVEADPLARLQTNRFNAEPNFEAPPASRVFASELQVFPNPTSGQLQVGGALEPGAVLRVIDPMGRVVLQRRLQEGEILIPLDLTKLAKGLYSVEIAGANGIINKKIVLN